MSSNNNHNPNDFNNFTNIMNGLASPGNFNDFQNVEDYANQSAHHHDPSRYQNFDQNTFEESDNLQQNDNISDDSYDIEEPGMSEEALARLKQSRREMKVRRGRKIKYENSICLECEEDGHKSQGGIWCYELDHHKGQKRVPKYVNCDECHKLVSGPKYTRHLNKCAPSGASTTQSTTTTTNNNTSVPQNVNQGMNNVLPLSGAVVSLAYDGASIASNTPQDTRNDNQSNNSIAISSQSSQQTKPRVILGNTGQYNQNMMQNNNNVMHNVPNNAPTFVIMPNPASNNTNNAFIQPYPTANNSNFMLNNPNMMAMINGMNLQQVSTMSQAPLSPKSNNSSNSMPTIVIPQQNATLQQQQQQQLFNVMSRLSPQNNYPTSPKQIVQIAPGTFGVQQVGSQNVGYSYNGANPTQQTQQQIIITNPGNRSTSPGGRTLDPNANQARAMNRLSPSVLVSAPISPNQQQAQQSQQYTKIIIPNGPNSPLQPQQPGNIFQQYMEQPQTSYLSASSFTNNQNISPSYQQLSPNQQGWQNFPEGSPALSPGASSTQNSQKKRKRNGSNAGSNQGPSTSEGDYVEIRDDLIKKLSEESDENVYSLRLYNETTRQYTVLMSTVHKPVKQLCSSKKRKKLNQILAPVLTKFGVDAETLIQIKEVRALIKSNRKPSSYTNANNDNESDTSEERNNQPIVSQTNPTQITGSMMGMLNEIPIINEPTPDYYNFRPKENEDETQLDFGIMQGSFLQSLNDPNSH